MSRLGISGTPPVDLRSSVTRGVAWMVLARWVVKGLGFVSTIVLARLLMPEDFGLVAMAMIVVGLTQTIFSMGVDTALIQNSKADETHYDTAWTIRIIQNLLVAAVVFLTAPLAASYYDESRVVPVLQALALSAAISGFGNIGTVAFRKELQFSREFNFQLIGKLASVVPTIALAWWLRDYWALVYGMLTGSVIGLLLSYVMHPYRPRLSMVRVKEIWGFSQWLLIVNLGYYAYTKADQFVIGGSIGSTGLGTYAVASEIAELPSAELIAPISRVVVPGFAKIKDDPERLRTAYLKVHGVIATLALPAGVGLALTAPEVVSIILGQKWQAAIPVIQWLAVYAALRAIYGSVGNLMIVMGFMKALAIVTWIELGLLVVGAMVGGQMGGIVGVAAGKCVLAVGMGCVFYLLAARLCQVSLRSTVRSLVRPVLATFAMTAAVLAADGLLSGQDAMSLAAAKIMVGAITYTAAIGVAWLAAGRPAGPELELLRVVKQ